jgi:hypothetical protein
MFGKCILEALQGRAECLRCGEKVEFEDVEGQYRCPSCKESFQHLCDVCGTPYNGELAVCASCDAQDSPD